MCDGEQWGEVFFYVKLPSRMDTEGSITVSVCNTQKRSFFIDDLNISLWRK